MKKYYQSAKLVERVNWDAIMPLPRYAGGHDEQMKNLLKDVTLIAHWNEGDYQGMVATCVQLNDTKEVVIYNDYYGSCSGCDAWEGATDSDVRQMCRQLATGAYIFKSLEDCQEFLAEGDTETSFDWETPRLPLLREIRFSQILCDPAILARLKTHGFEECESSHDTCDQCDVFSSRLWVDDDGEYCLDCALKKIQGGEDFLKNVAVWAEENKCPECGFPDDAEICPNCGCHKPEYCAEYIRLPPTEKRTDLREGDDVVIHIRGTFEEIRDHGTHDKPRWVAHVQTRSGWHSVLQEDVTPYVDIPDPLRYCPVCGREKVWDDLRRDMPVLICPRCAYDELKRLEALKASLQRSMALALKLGGVLASAERENTDEWMAYRDAVIADANREIAVLSLSSPFVETDGPIDPEKGERLP